MFVSYSCTSMHEYHLLTDIPRNFFLGLGIRHLLRSTLEKRLNLCTQLLDFYEDFLPFWRFFYKLKVFCTIDCMVCHGHILYVIYIVYLISEYLSLFIFVYVSKYVFMLCHIYSFVSKKCVYPFVLKYILVWQEDVVCTSYAFLMPPPSMHTTYQYTYMW